MIGKFKVSYHYLEHRDQDEDNQKLRVAIYFKKVEMILKLAEVSDIDNKLGENQFEKMEIG